MITTESFLINKIETPNPNAMKFQIEGFLISPESSIEFNKNSNQSNGFSSKLSNSLLERDFITSVFFGYDFISIIKTDGVSWDKISSDIIFTIMQYEEDIRNNTIFVNLNDNSFSDENVECDEADLNIVNMIQEFLDEVIKPQIAMDGGDIQLKAYKNKIAYLQLKGACSSCPSSTQTLYYGVREMLITNIPDVMDIEQVYC
jgi:Fe-S cluster biogenesis protein NfuA